MKFLVAPGFLASAMALATPIGKSNNKQDGVSMSDSQADLQDISIGTTRYVGHIERVIGRKAEFGGPSCSHDSLLFYRQEPEAVSLVKRVGFKVWFKIPINHEFSETELLISGVTVMYAMALHKVRQHGTSAAEYLCKSLTFANQTARNILISILTDDDTPIGQVQLKPGSIRSVSKLVEQYSGETVKAFITEIE